MSTEDIPSASTTPLPSSPLTNSAVAQLSRGSGNEASSSSNAEDKNLKKLIRPVKATPRGVQPSPSQGEQAIEQTGSSSATIPKPKPKPKPKPGPGKSETYKTPHQRGADPRNKGKAKVSSTKASADRNLPSSDPDQPFVNQPGLVWARNVNRFDLVFPKGHPRTLEYRARGYGVIELPKHGDPNPHEVSAAMRRLATCHALNALYRKGCRKVLSVFGAQRDIDIARWLNKNHIKDQEDELDPLELWVYRPTITSADTVRDFDEDHFVDSIIGDYDGYLFVNVYAHDKAPLTPDVFQLYGAPCALVRHSFNGACGTVEMEGGWFRLPDNTVIHRSDVKADTYHAHDPCDWLDCDGSASGVTWTTYRNVGDTVVTLVTPGETRSAGRVRPAPHKAWQELPLPELPEWLPSPLVSLATKLLSTPLRAILLNLKTRSIMIDERFKLAFRRWLVGRGRTSYGYKQLALEMQAFVKEDKQARLLDELFPELFTDMNEDTVWLIYLESIERSAFRARAVRSKYGETLEGYNRDLQNIASPLPPQKTNFWRILAIAALFFVAWKLRSWMSYRPQANLWDSIRHLFSYPALSWVFLLAVVRGNIGSMWERIKRELNARTWGRRLLGVVHGVSGKMRTLTPKCVMSAAKSGLVTTYYWISGVAVPTVGRSIRDLPIVEFEDIRRQTQKWDEFIAPRIQPPNKTGFVARCTWLTALGLNTLALINVWCRYITARWPITMLAIVSLEEYIKAASPSAAPLIFSAEVFISMFTHGRVFDQFVCSGLVHLVVPYFFGPAISWMFHLWWNLGGGSMFAVQANLLGLLRAALSTGDTEVSSRLWKIFREEYYELPWAQRPYAIDDGTRAVIPIPINDAWLPRQTFSHTPDKPRDPNYPVTGKLAVETDPLDRKYWVMITFTVPGYVPARSDANLLTVLNSRVLVPPPLDPARQAVNWKGVPVYFRLQWSPMDWEDFLEPWRKHMDKPLQLQRVEEAIQRLKEGTWSHDMHQAMRKVKLFVKTDEMLYKLNGMKPRPIANVQPLVQAVVGPFIWACTERLREEWPFDYSAPLKVGRWTLHITYGAKSTDLLLTEWLRTALDLPEYSAAVIVAGDDSLVVVSLPGRLIIYEGDAAMYDQSESFGPLEAQYCGMHYLGCPTWATGVLRKVARSTYIAESRNKHDKITVKRTKRPIRDTGGGDTSFGNSYVMGTAWADCFRCGMVDTAEAVQQHFLYLGFSLKVRVHDSPYRCTFLKGMWYETATGPFWGPLPSRVLKFGKSLRDPRELYQTKDLEVAMRSFLADLAVGYSAFLQVPCLRVLVSKFRNYRPVPKRRAYVAERLFYGVEADSAARHCDVADWSPVAQHYGVDVEDLRDFEALLLEADVSSLVAHPVAWRMAIQDYN